MTNERLCGALLHANAAQNDEMNIWDSVGDQSARPRVGWRGVGVGARR